MLPTLQGWEFKLCFENEISRQEDLVDFAREEYSESLAAELFPLNQSHNDEVFPFTDIKLEPDYEQYGIFEKTGMLRIFTVRSGLQLFGYAFFFVTKSAHYKNSIQACEDMLYLSPEVRKGFTAARFIKWCDTQLKNEGVQVVYQNVTHYGKNFGMVLERIGYVPFETLYARRLDTWERE